MQGIRHIVLAGARSPVSFFAYPGQPSDLVPDGTSVHALADPTEDVSATLEALADRVAPRTVPRLAGLDPPAPPARPRGECWTCPTRRSTTPRSPAVSGSMPCGSPRLTSSLPRCAVPTPNRART